MLISVYSFGLFKAISTDQGSKWPMIGFVLCGLFMALSGIFPGDFDNRQSATMVLHVIGSFGSYTFFLVGAFSYPKQMKKSDYWKTAVKPTLLFTWLTILFGVWPYIFPTMPAVGQRVIFFFFFLWIFYTAIKLIRCHQESMNEKISFIRSYKNEKKGSVKLTPWVFQLTQKEMLKIR